MKLKSYRILLVEPDPEIMELLVSALVRRLNAHVTCVTDAEDCLDIEMLDPHDLVIAELELEKMDGIELTERLSELSPRPVILLADRPGKSQLLKALRAGACNLFPKPFRVARLLNAAEQELKLYRAQRQERARYRELRGLVRHVLRDRRTLNQRVELVCRDLVGAHRRLVSRVLEVEVPPVV